MTVGGTYTVRTQDGQSMTGRLGLIAPDRVWLYHPAGIHVVWRRAIVEVIEPE